MKNPQRRQDPRVDFRVAVRVENQSLLQQFYSRNLSQGGIFLEIPGDPPPIGSKLKLSFDIPPLGRAITAEAEVVHLHPFDDLDKSFTSVKRFGVGLRFVNVNSGDKKILKNYVSGKDLHVNAKPGG